MSARLIDGKAMASFLHQQIKVDVQHCYEDTGIRVKLAVVLVGEDPASHLYVRNKERACQEVGIQSEVHRLSHPTTQGVLDVIQRLNDDATVTGILVQLPLLPGISEEQVVEAIDPLKDVDGLHPDNLGRLAMGKPRFVPCTPLAVQQILIAEHIPTCEKRVVIVGRSNLVGTPLSILLSRKGVGADATVTLCHSRTKDLPDITRTADVLVAAIGKANYVTSDMVAPGAVVVDVGINRTQDGSRFVGDIDFASVSQVASVLTPVPGGVGPLTVTMLLQNALAAARLVGKT